MTVDEKGYQQFRRSIEAGAAGAAYSSGLVALSVLAVASFRPEDLPYPYVGRIAWLRTDTIGIFCFILATLALGTSEYLRLSCYAARRSAPVSPLAGVTPHSLTTAAARALIAAGTALVVYVSVNAITHPYTLTLPATHILSWPTEGTLRAVSLIVVACSVAIERAQRINYTRGE